MNVRSFPFGVLLVYVLTSCSTKTQETLPTAPPFDVSLSDPAAVELADSIAQASGGQQAWEKTRFIAWETQEGNKIFFDKETGKVRLESSPTKTIYLLNVYSGKGRVQHDGAEIDEATKAEKISEGLRQWISDSYSLLLPFKLKEAGVDLTYLGEDTLSTGSKSNVLELRASAETHKSINRLRVYVDLADNKIKQIATYDPTKTDSLSDRVSIEKYETIGNLLLPTTRSDAQGSKSVTVDEISAETFDQF